MVTAIFFSFFALIASPSITFFHNYRERFFACQDFGIELAYGANFALRSWGGMAQATIHAHNLPASAITFVSRTAEQWSIGVWDSHGAGYGGVPLDQQGDDLYGQAISTLPPYFAQNIIVRAL